MFGKQADCLTSLPAASLTTLHKHTHARVYFFLPQLLLLLLLSPSKISSCRCLSNSWKRVRIRRLLAAISVHDCRFVRPGGGRGQALLAFHQLIVKRTAEDEVRERRQNGGPERNAGKKKSRW